jgi:hypothetical protein
MKDKVKAILIALAALVLFAGLCALLSAIRCQQLTSPPIVPIYPGSIVIEEVAGGTDAFPVREYHYISTASPGEIVEFYTRNKAQCHRTSGLQAGQVCTGDAKEFGIYSVGISFEFDKIEPLTTYFISVRWTGCGNFD